MKDMKEMIVLDISLIPFETYLHLRMGNQGMVYCSVCNVPVAVDGSWDISDCTLVCTSCHLSKNNGVMNMPDWLRGKYLESARKLDGAIGKYRLDKDREKDFDLSISLLAKAWAFKQESEKKKKEEQKKDLEEIKKWTQ